MHTIQLAAGKVPPGRLSKLFRSSYSSKGKEDSEALVADARAACLDFDDDEDYGGLQPFTVQDDGNNEKNRHKECGNSGSDMGPSMTVEKTCSSGLDSPYCSRPSSPVRGVSGSMSGPLRRPSHTSPNKATRGPPKRSCSSDHAMIPRMLRRHSITSTCTTGNGCSGPINISKQHDDNDQVAKRIIQVKGEIKVVAVDKVAIDDENIIVVADEECVGKAAAAVIATNTAPKVGPVVRRRLSLSFTPLSRRPHHDNLDKKSDLDNSNSNLKSSASSHARLHSYEPSSPSSIPASGTLKTEDSRSSPTSSPADSKVKETSDNEVKRTTETSVESSKDDIESSRTASADSKHESESSKASTENDSQSKPTGSPTDSETEISKEKTDCCVNEHERAIEERQLEITKLKQQIKEHQREQKRLADEKKRIDTINRLKSSATRFKEERRTSMDSTHSRSKKTSSSISPKSKKACVDASKHDRDISKRPRSTPRVATAKKK
jgi:hypothetical protein